MGLLTETFLTRRKYTKNLGQIARRTNSKETSTGSTFDEYDVIIIGGGTSGCVLAARLSEDPNIRVLLLEAGGSGLSELLTRIPNAYPLLFHTNKDYNLYTEPQKNAGNRPRYWPRAKMLGGCSSMNAQMAQYGAPSDFDEWAKIVDDDSWAWDQFSQFFRKFEKYEYDPDHPGVDTRLKGTDGPVRVGFFPVNAKASTDFVAACKKLGLSPSADFTQPAGVLGANKIMTYVDEKRERVSSESAYFTPNVLARPNLRVAIRATVTRILFEKMNGRIRAVGVEFSRSRRGVRYQARSKKNVILSAGAVHSPHILLLSGVGPVEQLKEYGIQAVHDLPGVGEHLVDHPVVDIYFKNKFNVSSKYLMPRSLVEGVQMLHSLTKYLRKREGALASNFGECVAFLRSDDPNLFPDCPALKDGSSGPQSPDIEVFSTPVAYKEHGAYMFPMHTFSLHAVLLRPLSKGALRLKSSNPFEHPKLDPNYLEAPEDVERLVRGVKLILNIARTEPLAAHLDLEDRSPLLDSELHTKSNEELGELIRKRVETLYHPTSTCRMAPMDDQGVVDSKLRVYVIEGLRVCDASIFPNIVAGHTTGACLAIAEKLADELKQEYNNYV
ncbi:hypothetical protein APHAL10511_004509 [Amanita phalloides]|nr:hypothetical protein APHAL10511_004509 [Amanita phalloides]